MEFPFEQEQTLEAVAVTLVFAQLASSEASLIARVLLAVCGTGARGIHNSDRRNAHASKLNAAEKDQQKQRESQRKLDEALPTFAGTIFSLLSCDRALVPTML
jgi:hypothetical protein